MFVFGTLAFTPHKLVLCVAQPGNTSNAKTFVGPSCTDVDVDVVSRRHEGIILDLSQWAMLWLLEITTSRLISHSELMVHAGCRATR